MGRHALLVGTSTYDDRSLENLPGVRHDLDQLKAVLDQGGQFDTVDVLLDRGRDQLANGIEVFFGARKPGDLAFFYYSGHGLVADDRDRSLFLAATNSTKDGGLHGGAVDTDGVLRHCLNSTRASEKVVLLDCCFSGSFELRGRFQSSGRRQPRRGVRETGTFMLTATTHLKAAKSQGADRPSVFTGAVLDGLRGKAGDGAEWITTDDLSRYVLANSKTQATESREGVTEPIRLVLGGSGPRDGSRSMKKKATGHSTAADAELDTDQWRRLLEYYVTCLERSAVISSFVEVSATNSYLVFPAGSEQVFSGS
ncbi:MAG: hypothetical protein QOH03_3695, partial [Kribbellaceae bacterium]|nr:hypothetical protein [Kribbellaceae bacterium]